MSTSLQNPKKNIERLYGMSSWKYTLKYIKNIFIDNLTIMVILKYYKHKTETALLTCITYISKSYSRQKLPILS